MDVPILSINIKVLSTLSKVQTPNSSKVKTDPITCLLVPRTPHGQLARDIRDLKERLQNTGLNNV